MKKNKKNVYNLIPYPIGFCAHVKGYLPFFNEYILNRHMDTDTICGSIVHTKSQDAVVIHSFPTGPYPHLVDAHNEKRSKKLC